MRQSERRTAFILAAGLGTRLKDLTADKPKALVELNEQPLLEIVIDNLISQRFNHFVINVHHFADKIIDFIKEKNYENVEIEISDETDFLYNTGGAIIKALPYFQKSKAVLIHNVDIISDIDLQTLYDDFVESDDAAWLLTQERNNKRKLVFDENNLFLGKLNLETKEYDGDISLKDSFKQLSFSGLHFIKPEYFNEFELNACYVFDLYKEIAKKENVRSILSKFKYWFDLGTKEQLKEASSWLISKDFFITKITDFIIENHDLTKDSITVIFPNKRAALMLRKELAKRIKYNIWLPQIYSIQEAMSAWSRMQLIENIDLTFELLKIMKHKGLASSNNLFGLASQMAKDFDEIDQYNVNAEKLFNYLKEYKAMETWIPNDENNTSVESNYIEFFKSLYAYYEKIRDILTKRNCGYYGLITRKLASLNDEELIKSVGNNKVIFAGFNAMTSTEENIIVRLVNNDKATILWDLDKYYFDDNKQEAGLFAREFFSKHKNIEKNFIGDNFKNKNINIIGVSGSSLQANALQIQLSKIKSDEYSAKKDVVVLSDETLLIPVLNSIPSNYKDAYNNIQVTMGYPYSKTIVHQFLTDLFSLQNQISENKIYFWSLKRLLETEIIKVIFNSEEISSLSKSIDTLTKQSTYHLDINKLDEYFKNNILHFISLISRKWNIENCIPTIKEILIYINNTLTPKMSFVKNQISVAGRIFNKIEKLSSEYQSLIQLIEIEILYKQSSNEMSIKLENHDDGLQIMGLLETRNLDFRTVHILSVNEGILPQTKSANSLIPFDLRIAYNLPIYKNKQAVYAYHFYRLLQNAKNINIYYNTLADGMGEGEPSRFIRQILHEIHAKGNNINITDTIYKNPKININNISEIRVNKKDVMEKIKNKIAPQTINGEIKGLSPTSISCYLKCPLQFYLKYIENVQDNTPEELIQANIIGSIIHSTFENLYKNFGERTIVNSEIYNLIVERELKASFHKALEDNKFPNGLPDSGFNYLSEIMINELIDNFTSYEKNNLSKGQTFEILGLEKKLHHSFNIGVEGVNLIGFADRIDLVNGKTIRIIDYKSGSVDNKDVQIQKNATQLSDLTDKSLQRLIYKYFYKKMHKDDVNTEDIEPAIFGLLKMNNVLFPLSNNSNTFRDKTDEDDENFMNKCDLFFQELFEEILNPEVDFIQTSNDNNCINCRYTDICKRNPQTPF